jgi:integrase/recombinase XerD
MIEDMSVRSFDPHTQSDYIRAVKKLTAFLGHSPDKASAEDLRRFQVHLRQTCVPAPTVNSTVSALRFFYRVTLSTSRKWCAISLWCQRLFGCRSD